MVDEFRVSEIKQEVFSELRSSDKDSSALKIARPILNSFEEFTDDQKFSLGNPLVLRDELHRFFQDGTPRNYSRITNQHLRPVKIMLEIIAEQSEVENPEYALMIRDNLRAKYFQEEDYVSATDVLEKKILTPKELSILKGKVEGKQRFIVSLILETTAKVGVVAGLMHGDFPDSNTDLNKVNIRRQYREGDGLRELDYPRKREVKISDELYNQYKKQFSDDTKGYIFGANAKHAHSRVRNLFGRIDVGNFQISPSIIRDTAGYTKLRDGKSPEDLRYEMGLNGNARIKRYEGVLEVREQAND